MLNFKSFITTGMVLCIALTGLAGADIYEGLLGYWPLDEGAGLVTGDLAGSNDGTLEAGVNWVTGKLGSAMETNVGTQAIRMSPEPAYLTPNMSVACWAITEEAGWGEWAGIVGHCYDTGSTEAGWALYEDGALGTVEFYASQAGAMVTLSVSGVTTGVWNHWVGTVSDTAITVYLNGQEAASLPFAGGVDYSEKPATWDMIPVIGTYLDDDENEYFNGSVDEVAIWDRALTADEVAALYNDGAGFALPLAVRITPADNGQLFVPIETMLEWAAPPGQVVSAYDVWFGTDPNTESSVYDFNKILDYKDLTMVDPSPGGDLDYGTLYYWRVDMYEPNLVPGGGDIFRGEGMEWSFRTLPEAPVILTQPVGMIIAAGDTAEFTIGGSNIQTCTWYRSDDAANDTPADDVVVGDDSALLSIADVEFADEGYYYCVAANGGLTDVSDVASLILEQIIHYYPLDNESAADAVGGVNGTVVGDPNWIAGIDGGAIDMFPATMSALEDYIVLGEVGDIIYGADDFTVSFWMKTPPGFSGDPALMSNKDWDSGSNVGWVIAWGGSGDGIYQWNFDTSGPSRDDYDPTGPETADNQWHLVTVTHDRQGMATFYIDGEVRGAVDISAHAGHSIDAGFPTVIGNDGMQDYHVKYPDARVRCAFDDVRIYNYALDSVEVATLYTDFVAGVWVCANRPLYDFSGDCVIGLADIALLFTEWLDCGLHPSAGCP